MPRKTDTAFETATTVTFENRAGRFVTERVVSRVRPATGSWGLKAVRTESGEKVRWIDVIGYTLPKRR